MRWVNINCLKQSREMCCGKIVLLVIKIAIKTHCLPGAYKFSEKDLNTGIYSREFSCNFNTRYSLEDK